MSEFMLRGDWTRCAHCPRVADAIVTILVGDQEIDEPVCMCHIWGPDAGLLNGSQIQSMTERNGPGTPDKG